MGEGQGQTTEDGDECALVEISGEAAGDRMAEAES